MNATRQDPGLGSTARGEEESSAVFTLSLSRKTATQNRKEVRRDEVGTSDAGVSFDQFCLDFGMGHFPCIPQFAREERIFPILRGRRSWT